MCQDTPVSPLHVAEYEKLRDEICLRIQLQDKALGYAAVMTASLLAAMAGWILKEPVAFGQLLRSSEINAKAIVLLLGYVVILELFICSWIYHTFMCLRTDAYVTILANKLNRRKEHDPQSELLGYQAYQRPLDGIERGPILTQRYGIVVYLQPAALYGLALMAAVAAEVLCVSRAAFVGWCASSLALISAPVILFAALGWLLRLHFRVHNIPLPPEPDESEEETHTDEAAGEETDQPIEEK